LFALRAAIKAWLLRKLFQWSFGLLLHASKSNKGWFCCLVLLVVWRRHSSFPFLDGRNDSSTHARAHDISVSGFTDVGLLGLLSVRKYSYIADLLVLVHVGTYSKITRAQ